MCWRRSGRCVDEIARTRQSDLLLKTALPKLDAARCDCSQKQLSQMSRVPIQLTSRDKQLIAMNIRSFPERGVISEYRM